MSEKITIYPLPTAAASTSPAQIAKGTGAPLIANDSFFSGSFADILDTLNPLQHLPVISNIYRALTGDTAPSTGAQLAGDTLFGGPMGLIGNIANNVLQSATGKDLVGNMASLFSGTDMQKFSDGSLTNYDYVPNNRRAATELYQKTQALV